MTDWPPQPPALPTISVSQTDALTALRAFLTGVVAPTTDVIRAQINRVPEPAGSDFIVMTPIAQERLETNETAYADVILVGSISGTTLTATSIMAGSIRIGALLTDTVWPTMNVAVGTTVVKQLTGTPGGAGTYQVNNAQNLPSETLYAGVRSDLVATKWTVQLDVHGPASGDNVRIVETLFRSEYGVDAISVAGFDMAPLYAESARQIPFINAEQQYEDRWTLDVHLQINPVVGTPQLFADEVVVGTVEVDAIDLLIPMTTLTGAPMTTLTGEEMTVLNLVPNYGPRVPVVFDPIDLMLTLRGIPMVTLNGETMAVLDA